ncbi:MAG: 5'/3'-nucleotidase SurE [Acidobacteriota bacterium]
MKLLLTNDDGVDAQGLESLLTVARDFGQCLILAPAGPVSGCSHKVTTQAGIRVEQRGKDRLAVYGTPADCVRLAIYQLLPDVAWVLSGINEGGNLGADIFHSGTVAAIREAALLGKRGIAFSQYRKRGVSIDWRHTETCVAAVLPMLIARPLRPGSFWNVNLPALLDPFQVPEVVFCPLDTSPLPLSYRAEDSIFHYDANYHLRSRQPGTDTDLCFGGKISVTELTLT